MDDVAAVTADYGKGTLVAVGESFPAGIQLSFLTDFIANTHGYELVVNTLCRSTKDFIHVDQPRLEPGQSLGFDLSLRFGPENTGLYELAGDVFAEYGKRIPRALKWTDRRPIAMLMLASSAAQHHSATNPRGWLSDPRINTTTPQGRAVFKKKVMGWANRSVSQCRLRDAQGVIVWDVEGEEFGPIVFVGDPRMLPQLAPELDEIADEVFKKFSDAGLKTGVCIRPSRIARSSDSKTGSPWRHNHMAFDPVKEMADKISYAKTRWGCSLFYIDTNVTWAFAGKKEENARTPTSWVMRADSMRRLAELFPDVLIIPEHQYLGYYSHVSGYKELRANTFGGYAATPQRVLLAYPDAFSVINISDGKLRERRAELLAAVRRGDILLFRGWFNSPENAMVHSIYQEARTSR